MAKRIKHKQGATFSYAGKLSKGVDGNFTGWTLDSVIRDSKGALIADLEPYWVDIEGGAFQIRVETENWPLASNINRAAFDVELTAPDGAKIPSPTIFVEIIEGPTNG